MGGGRHRYFTVSSTSRVRKMISFKLMVPVCAYQVITISSMWWRSSSTQDCYTGTVGPYALWAASTDRLALVLQSARCERWRRRMYSTEPELGLQPSSRLASFQCITGLMVWCTARCVFRPVGTWPWRSACIAVSSSSSSRVFHLGPLLGRYATVKQRQTCFYVLTAPSKLVRTFCNSPLSVWRTCTNSAAQTRKLTLDSPSFFANGKVSTNPMAKTSTAAGKVTPVTTMETPYSHVVGRNLPVSSDSRRRAPARHHKRIHREVLHTHRNPTTPYSTDTEWKRNRFKS